MAVAVRFPRQLGGPLSAHFRALSRIFSVSKFGKVVDDSRPTLSTAFAAIPKMDGAPRRGASTRHLGILSPKNCVTGYRARLAVTPAAT